MKQHRRQKRGVVLLSVFLAAVLIYLPPSIRSGQDVTHDVSVVNVEVPVRVFKGQRFVDNLTLQDFEVFEDGTPQTLNAVYLVKKAQVTRGEVGEVGHKGTPRLARNYFLIFELLEYQPQMEEVIDYFFAEVITDGDSLTIITPVKTYRYRPDALFKLGKERIVNQLKGLLRRDIIEGARSFRSLLSDLQKIESVESDIDFIALSRRTIIWKMKERFRLDLAKLTRFAEQLKNIEGRKFIYMFYQRHTVPVPITTIEPDIEQSDFYIDYSRIKRAYSDSSISLHFMYLSQAPFQRLGMGMEGIRLMDLSNSFFNAFQEMANATGGISMSTRNAFTAFQQAYDASENYYLIYYSPKKKGKDGSFRRITVRVKGGGFRILHRAGYYAGP